jgi:protein tyrosine phosphatase (PTP) superfamily phosphohydrolase (DUF442 family)
VTARSFGRWALGLAIVVLLTVVPFIDYRATYAHAKRLREVTPGVLYRSGQLTTAGFAEACEKFGIRTVVNLQDEYEDPGIREGYLIPGECPESEVCARLGVRYVWMAPGLIAPNHAADERPETIDRFLKLMDEPANYPVLIHCRAGLHRTGCLVAVYRMEYEGWTRGEALGEMIDNGFGRFAATSANEYIAQYVLGYEPRRSRPSVGGTEAAENPR